MRTAVSTPGAHDQPLPILECRTDTKTTSRFRLPVVSLCMCTQPFCWHRAQTPPRSDRRLAGQASGRLCHGAASQLLALPPQLCFRDCWQPAEDVQHPAQGVQTCTWQARPLQHIILRLQPSGSCSSNLVYPVPRMAPATSHRQRPPHSLRLCCCQQPVSCFDFVVQRVPPASDLAPPPPASLVALICCKYASSLLTTSWCAFAARAAGV